MQVELSEAELCHIGTALDVALGGDDGGPLTEKGRAELEAVAARLGALWLAAFGAKTE